MTTSPFPGDPAAAARTRHLADTIGARVTKQIAGLADARRPSPDAGDQGIVLREEVDGLVAEFDLDGPEQAMLLALPSAAALARPPISGYVVGVVGLASGTGDLVLGGNLEFPGTSLATTIHAEGVVGLRAFARGASLEAIALTQARPCAHCRQVLAEFAWADGLRIIDLARRELRMADLYPWPFAPGDLEQPAAVPGAVEWPGLAVPADDVPGPVAARLDEAGARAHVPYSGTPAAVVLELAGDRLVAGAPLESVAYNPGLGPLQAALAELPARGVSWDGIRAAWLATADGPVDHATATRTLLAAIAPNASLHVVRWR
jgi:cytidine deaminase